MAWDLLVHVYTNNGIKIPIPTKITINTGNTTDLLVRGNASNGFKHYHSHLDITNNGNATDVLLHRNTNNGIKIPIPFTYNQYWEYN